MKSLNNIVKKIVLTITAICFWLFVWHFLSLKINSSIFLPSPEATYKALIRIGKRAGFWQTIFNTFSKIAKGFLLALIAGTFSAIISSFVKIIDVLVSPFMRLLKTVPVASFIILALLWVKSDKLSVLISFVMVTPVVYINILQSFDNVDNNLLEMADIFNVGLLRRLRFIYVPALVSGFMSACKIGLGFCFKAGIAAEIIGLPFQSIGSELYKSKLYLMTDELFAWTVVIVLMSVFFEGVCIYLLNKLSCIIEKTNISRKAENENKADKSHKKKGEYEKLENNNILMIKEITKSYGKQKVLENISFNLNESERICIYGKSGIGKTTLLRIIAGLEKADSGKITFMGKVSMVFQEDRLLENTDVYTNLYCVLGSRFDKAEADMHLKEVGLEGAGNKIVSELSGGMKRRVAIVRCMMKSSEIILLDEPFKGLDTILKDNIIRYVVKYLNGRAVIMVTHDISEAEKIQAEIIEIKNLGRENENIY
jgi:NitT/TauT family transport system permease protein